MVKKMKVYIDLILITNFLFDFILLLATSIILKRDTKVIRVILGSLFGSITILSLFIRFSTIKLFFFKIIVSVIMLILSFGFRNYKYFLKNMYYFYMISIFLGGILYFINIQFSYRNEGLLFITTGTGINVIIGIILSLIILYRYIKQIKLLKTNYNKYYKTSIYFKNGQILSFNAFLDTGNKLIDPYKKWPIILVNENKIKYIEKTILVPYHTVNGKGLLKCIKPDRIYIEGIGFKNKLLVGLSSSINIDGVDCILNEKLLEG